MEKRQSEKIAYICGEWPFHDGRPTLVFVHGAGGSSVLFEDLVEGLKDKANTLAIDLPGHGDSPGPGRDSVNDYAREVADLVRELDPPSPVIAGLSMGGAISQQCLLDYAGLFRAGILLSTGAKLKVMPAIFEKIVTDFPGYLQLLEQFAVSPQTDAGRLSRLMEDNARRGPQVVLDDFKACDAFDVRDRLSEIKAPVLIITAEDDKLTPPKYGEYLEGAIPTSRRIHLEGAGHLVAAEKPGEVIKAIASFIEEDLGR
jgi:pimeloyl-ACP methyl ester carboxylesterase